MVFREDTCILIHTVDIFKPGWDLKKTTRIGGQILGISPNGLHAGHCDAPMIMSAVS